MKRIIFIILITVACRKDDSDVVLTLPAATKTGADTFGFLQDGAVWTNYGQVCQPNGGSCRDNLTAAFSTNDRLVTIKADQVIYKDGVAHTQYFELNFQTDAGGENTYTTGNGDLITVLLLPPNDPFGFMPDDVNPEFTVTVTRLDTSAGIVSGTFSGKLFGRTSTGMSTADAAIITEGRFDLKYNP